MKDIVVEELIRSEEARQGSVVNLIASENYVSSDVLAALGSRLTDKYAEGYPGARYYAGGSVVDQVEQLAIDRARELFGLSPEEWHVNAQALSGSPANLAVYSALVPLGGKIMGMTLASGGHLTHAQPVSLTGKVWKQVPYDVDAETEVIDYEVLMETAMRERPDLIVAGFTAYPQVVDWARFRSIADACGAILMVDMSHIAGLVAARVYPSPFPYADVVTSTVHKTLRGPRAALIFARKDTQKGLTGLGKKIDRAIIPGLQGGPHMNAIAAVAVALREASTDGFKTYGAQVIKNAVALATELKSLGWHIISGGTASHMVLVDTWMQGSGISGKDAEARLEAAGIIVNKNAIPHDTRGVLDPSGIRLGTAAETTRGKVEADFVSIARQIDHVLRA